MTAPAAAGSRRSEPRPAQERGVDTLPRRGTRGWMATTGLVIVRWSRFGKHRIYVDTIDEESVGWLDLDTGERSLAKTELASAFEATLREAATSTDATDHAPRRTFIEPSDDLAGRRPGEHLEAQIAAAIQSGRELTPAHPDFEGRRAYSAMELGVLGERMVAEELTRLVAFDPRWAFLNSIPVGTHKADIDHLVVGPGGVFTVNTKHHHGADVWVAEGAFKVNHTWTHYVEDSRAEAARAQALLGAATGMSVAIMGLVVLVGVEQLTVKAQPADVRVLHQSGLVDFLVGRPPILGADTIARVLSAARKAQTWR